MNTMRKRIFLLALGALLLLAPAVSGLVISPVCIESGSQQMPAISGDTIVWSDNRNEATTGNDIYVYDIPTGTESAFCTAPADQNSPVISGDIIVWVDDRNYSTTEYDIYMWDPVHGEQAICTEPYQQVAQEIFGDIIVWEDSRDFATTGCDIYMWDPVHGEQPVCTDPDNQFTPTISGNTIIWSDGRNGLDRDIYMWDPVHGEKPVCTESDHQGNPAISGDIIVWEDHRNGDWDLYMYDLSGPISNGEPVCTEPGDQMSPAISGDIIVWQDNRNGDWDIYMYDLSNPVPNGEPVCTEPGDQWCPAISGDVIVWQDGSIDEQSGLLDIYMADLSADASDVTMFHVNPQHTGDFSSVSGGILPNGFLNWSLTTEGDIFSSPTVEDGVVYVGAQERFYALDAATGTPKWASMIGPVQSSPAVAEGVVFVGSDDDNVHALRASDGYMLWSFATAGDVISSPAVVHGVVYVGAQERFYALDAATGTVKWTSMIGPVRSSPAVVDGVVYVGSDDDNIHALRASDGSILWSFATAGDVFSSPAVVDGVVYVGAQERFYALDAATGMVKWTSMIGPVQSSPAVVDGMVYVGSDNDNVYALRASDGLIVWSFATAGDVVSSPAVADGVVYAGSDDDNVYVIDAATGIRKWAFPTGGNVASSPAVADGMVYIGSDDGKVYAIGSGAPAIAKSWDQDYALAGDAITYTCQVTNPCYAPLSSITVTDDICGAATYVEGDTSGDSLLDHGETWTYTCTHTPDFDTLWNDPSGEWKLTNTVTATGIYEGQEFSGTDDCTLYQAVVQKEVLLYQVNGNDPASAENIVYTPPASTTIPDFALTLTKNAADVGTIAFPSATPTQLWLSEGAWTIAEKTVPDGFAIVRASMTVDTDDWPQQVDTTLFNLISYDLGLTKTVDMDSITVTDANVGTDATVTYTLTVTNAGPASVQPAVSDPGCDDLQYTGGDENGNGYLDPDETWTYTGTRTVTLDAAGIPADLVLGNTAGVTDAAEPESYVAGGDPDAADNCDSATVTFCWDGLSHGYWKTHNSEWVIYSPAATVSSVFAAIDDGTAFDSKKLGDKTLADALKFKGGKGTDGAAEILLKQAVAALLNEAAFGTGYPPYGSAADLVAAVNDALNSNDRAGMIGLAGELDFWNNPSGGA